MFLTNSYTESRKLPANYNTKDEKSFEREFTHYIPPAEISKIKFGLIGIDGYLIDLPKFKVLSSHKKKAIDVLKLLFRSLIMVNTRHSEIFILDKWHGAYFHWITDVLPKVVLLKQYRPNCTILLPNSIKKHQKDSLEAVIGSAPIKPSYSLKHSATLVFNFEFVSYTAPTGNYHEAVLNKLRNEIREYYKVKNNSCNRRIYISRAKASKRKVSNEENMIPILDQFNIEIHYFEDYSFKEQVLIASEAELIIGLHGAGLTNMMFMNSEKNILELRLPEDQTNLCFYSMASALNLKYWYQFTEATQKLENYMIDVDEFGKVLKSILETNR